MEIFGKRAPSPEVMARVGFLPENPYIYPYLSPREFITMCGRLSGMKGPALRDRVVEVIRRVGIPEAIDRAARALSKGMLQRVGLAAAIVHDPELLVLDEPMSGLDPVGRKEVRDLIVEEKHRGRTVFFSSHILSDVEMLCDRVCILRQGEVVVSGALRDLLGSGKRRSEITIGGASTALRDALAPMAHVTRAVGDVLVMEVDGDAQVKAVVERAFLEGARLESVAAKTRPLIHEMGAPRRRSRARILEMRAPRRRSRARILEMRAPRRRSRARILEMRAPRRRSRARILGSRARILGSRARIHGLRAPSCGSRL
jgi:ABC-2 type transport system ATP-binding protein